MLGLELRGELRPADLDDGAARGPAAQQRRVDADDLPHRPLPRLPTHTPAHTPATVTGGRRAGGGAAEGIWGAVLEAEVEVVTEPGLQGSVVRLGGSDHGLEQDPSVDREPPAAAGV